MPDLGDIRHGLRKGAKSALGAADVVGDRLKRLRSDDSPEPEPPTAVPAEEHPGPGLAEEPEEHADESEVRELVDLLQAALDKRRPPPGPITQPWSFGVGVLLAEHPKVPRRLHWAVRKLDRFGGIAVNPEQIAFDGDEVDWDNVTEVQTRHVVDYLLGDLDLRIPAEIEYKGMLRTRKTLSAGVLSAVVLADPSVNRSIVETAAARGIPVRATGEEQLANATERAAALRQKVAALESELDRFTKRFGRRP